MTNQTAPKYEYPQPDARWFYVPCSATDEKREECLDCMSHTWIAPYGKNLECDECNQHWRKKVSVPDGWEVIGFTAEFPEEFKRWSQEHNDWLPCRRTSLSGQCEIVGTGGRTSACYIRRKPESAKGESLWPKDLTICSRCLTDLLAPDHKRKCAEALLAKSGQTEPSPAFWVVWRKDGSAPSKRHPAEADARKEAQRLADQSNERFYVLKACASYQRGPVAAKELQ